MKVVFHVALARQGRTNLRPGGRTVGFSASGWVGQHFHFVPRLSSPLDDLLYGASGLILKPAFPAHLADVSRHLPNHYHPETQFGSESRLASFDRAAAKWTFLWRWFGPCHSFLVL